MPKKQAKRPALSLSPLSFDKAVTDILKAGSMPKTTQTNQLLPARCVFPLLNAGASHTRAARGVPFFGSHVKCKLATGWQHIAVPTGALVSPERINTSTCQPYTIPFDFGACDSREK
jgi:hypothetical protein